MNLPPEITTFRDRLSVLGIQSKEEDFKHIVPILKRKSFKKGEIILNKGDICKETYFIVKGLLRSFQILSNGNEKTYVLANENRLFTEHTSFISQTPATDFLEAIEDTDVLSFTYDDLMKVYKKSHALESIGRQLSDVNFIAAKNKLMSLMNDDATTRYTDFLKTYKNILPRIPQNIIASYLGITPQSLSRLKKEFDIS
jgi:CRP-like cAMP-binding protein